MEPTPCRPPMHVLVCVKQVPDSREIRIDPATQTLIREGVPSIVNVYDQHAVAAAVRVARGVPGAKVTALSMGPPMAAVGLRESIALGAHRAVLISDRVFAGADTLATSYVLAEAIKQAGETWGPVDLVCCGKQTLDGDTGQVGPGLACRLGLEQLTYVEAIEDVDPVRRRIRVRRHLEYGHEIVETKLPALITVTEQINRVHRASLPALLGALRYQPVVWTAADLPQVDRTRVGLKGSPTVVAKAWVPQPVQREGRRLPAGDRESGESAARHLFDALAARGVAAQLGWPA